MVPNPSKIDRVWAVVRIVVYSVLLWFAILDLWRNPATPLRVGLAVVLFMCAVGWCARVAMLAASVLMLMRGTKGGPVVLVLLSSGNAFSFDALPRSEFFPDVRFPHPTPYGLLLWDGRCGFCKRMIDVLQNFVRRPLTTRPFQDVAADLPEAVMRQTGRQMHWVCQDGTIVGGSQALIEALDAGDRGFIAWMLGMPLLRPLTWAGYRIVASNRDTAGDLIGASCEWKPPTP